MTDGWVKIYSARELIQAKLAEDVLKQHGISSHIANKPDSVMPFLGTADLYTTQDDAEAAMKVLEENDLMGESEEEF